MMGEGSFRSKKRGERNGGFIHVSIYARLNVTRAVLDISPPVPPTRGPRGIFTEKSHADRQNNPGA